MDVRGTVRAAVCAGAMLGGCDARVTMLGGLGDGTAAAGAGSAAGSGSGSGGAGASAGEAGGGGAGTDAMEGDGPDGESSTTDAGPDASACGKGCWLYVANEGSDSVSVLSTATATVAASIPVGEQPRRVAFSPDGKRAWVANAGSATVSVIDVAGQKVVGTVGVGPSPWGLAFSADGARAYVTHPSGEVRVLSAATLAPVSSFATGAKALGIAVRPGVPEVWIGAALDGQNLQVFSEPANVLVGTIDATGMTAEVVAFPPDGSHAWVSSACGCCGNLRKVSAATKSVAWEKHWGSGGAGLAVSPDGQWVYAAHLGGVCGPTAAVVRIDATSGAVTATFGSPEADPEGLALSADGKTVWVARPQAGSVLALDATTLAAGKSVAVGKTPRALAVSP